MTYIYDSINHKNNNDVLLRISHDIHNDAQLKSVKPIPGKGGKQHNL